MKRFNSILIAIVLPITAQAANCGPTATGSYGGFAPSAFLKQAVKPWNVIRVSGKYKKSKTCGLTAVDCVSEKEYSFFKPRSIVTDKCIDPGRGGTLMDVQRKSNGVSNNVTITAPNGLNWLLIDGIGTTSRYGAEGTETNTMTRTMGELYGGGPENDELGHVEGKFATNATVLPSSFYYNIGGQPVFGTTVVSKVSPLGIYQKQKARSPHLPRLRTGTYWCFSDEFKEATGIMSLVQNEEFDLAACNRYGNMVLSSEAVGGVQNAIANFALNRMDSVVTLHERNFQYRIESHTDWLCPFDCDGSSYYIKLPGQDTPKISITSNVWNWLSSTRFKVKVIRVDWDNDGFQYDDIDTDLRTLADNPEAYRDIVAISVVQHYPLSDSVGDTTWHQDSFIIFPPVVRGGNIPSAYEGSKYANAYKKLSPHMGRMIYNMKLLDGILAMMPGQVSTSPELADLEEKLDELRLLVSVKLKYKGSGTEDKALGADLAFDVYSPVDGTTAISWGRPGSSKIKRGKIEWVLGQLLE